MPMKPYKPANPLIWGAVLALTVGAFAILGDFVGSSKPDNFLIATPLRSAGTAFAIGVVVAMFRNWFNERRH